MNAFRALLVVLTFLSFVGFIAQAQPEEKSSAPLSAIALLHPTAGNKLSGMVTFTEVADGVQVRAEITGLAPGNHGFHVHELGDCSAADASSAGAHFNPTTKPHAGPDAPERHVGDMGNVEADASGKATLEYVDNHICLTNKQQLVIRRIGVVYVKAHDLEYPPDGDSGT